MNTQLYSTESDDYQRIEGAICYLEENFRRHPSLEEIAGSVHLSKYHFQRLFKRWAGISPSQFLRFLTIEYAKQKLAESQSVLDAALEAGLSGPGRLHDLFVSYEAMTPGEYKRQGAGLAITYGIHATPFGQCLLATTQRGICDMQFLQDGDNEAAEERLTDRWPGARVERNEETTQPLIDALFATQPGGQPHPFHLLLRGTNFQVKVWQALMEIPPGAMVSYQDVANYLGKPSAARAVAGAVAKNPTAYLIPCHRVISKTGQIHNYRWGATRKKAILGWEASALQNN